MVNHIDIHNLTLEELSGVVDLYPWYAAARLELCRRMSKLGILSHNQISQTALHLSSRKIISKIASSSITQDYSDKDAKQFVRSYISEVTPQKKQVYVIGGDYFSQEQYNEARVSSDSVFSSFVNSDKEIKRVQNNESSDNDFCTETLAQIYLSQDYIEEAKSIYSKLSLRYPEKSIYFATLIDKIDKKAQ